MDTIFTWSPDVGSQLSEDPRVTVTQYGDGYECRTSFLINNNPKKWEVTFTGDLTRHRAILAFLRDHDGQYSFEWTDPNGDKGMYISRSWKSQQVSFGIFEVTSTFEQVFE
jgi:phage-related protein